MGQTLPTFDSENAQVRFPADPTRFPSGTSTRRKGHPFANMPLPDPFKTYNYYSDFPPYVATDWTLTNVGGGTAVLSVATFDYGALLMTTTAAAGDNVCLQSVANVRTALVTPAVGKRLWFAARIAVDDATNAAVVVGAHNTDTTPITSLPTDGIYFSKPAAATVINFVVANNGVSTTVAVGNIVAATMIELAFFYDPRLSTVGYFINGVSQGGAALTNLPTSADALRLSLAVQAGTAVIRTMSVDYALIANDR